MRRKIRINKFFAGIVLAVVSSAAAAQDLSNPEQLILELRDPATAERAGESLAVLGKRDDQVRASVAYLLPQLIADKPERSVRKAEVKLAGELRVEEAIPILTQLLIESNAEGGVSDIYRRSNLLDDSVGLALSKMGNAAVPALGELLKKARWSARERALRILFLIKTPESQQALRDHLPSENDALLRAMIVKRLPK